MASGARCFEPNASLRVPDVLGLVNSVDSQYALCVTRRIRMIWDFFGPDAKRTAEHHRLHLDEFVMQTAIERVELGVSELAQAHWAAWLIVDEPHVADLRGTLRPQRGLLESDHADH